MRGDLVRGCGGQLRRLAVPRAAAGLRGLWFHDLRRSFITRARRVGVPESVVMKMSGHRTRAVFERYNVVDTRTCERQCARSRVLDTFRTHPGVSAPRNTKAPPP
jgi:integrase